MRTLTTRQFTSLLDMRNSHMHTNIFGRLDMHQQHIRRYLVISRYVLGKKIEELYFYLNLTVKCRSLKRNCGVFFRL